MVGLEDNPFLIAKVNFQGGDAVKPEGNYAVLLGGYNILVHSSHKINGTGTFDIPVYVKDPPRSDRT